MMGVFTVVMQPHCQNEQSVITCQYDICPINWTH